MSVAKTEHKCLWQKKANKETEHRSLWQCSKERRNKQWNETKWPTSQRQKMERMVKKITMQKKEGWKKIHYSYPIENRAWYGNCPRQWAMWQRLETRNQCKQYKPHNHWQQTLTIYTTQRQIKLPWSTSRLLPSFPHWKQKQTKTPETKQRFF